ncbi:MAG: hypothetical protein IT565_04350 [Rhodospirillales bacterium]|nr:hypothetical protein [Rhodospirillales bacterium]
MTDLTVLFFGDDQTLPDGDEAGLGWIGRLARAERRFGSAVSFYPLGVAGDRTADIARRWSAETALRLPEGAGGLLVFAFGRNDMAAADDQTLRANLPETLFLAEEILRNARELRPVLWLGPAPLGAKEVELRDPEDRLWRHNNSRVAGLNESFRTLARAIGVPYLDLYNLLLPDHRYMRALKEGDKIHPAGEGHALIADHVCHWHRWRDHMALVHRPPETNGLKAANSGT